ncbi:MAG: hypothetical protein CL489_10645 [Acidobacteria bacterium]|nr:hypothetical protein [Acidobacteriota bacterium]
MPYRKMKSKIFTVGRTVVIQLHNDHHMFGNNDFDEVVDIMWSYEELFEDNEPALSCKWRDDIATKTNRSYLSRHCFPYKVYSFLRSKGFFEKTTFNKILISYSNDGMRLPQAYL